MKVKQNVTVYSCDFCKKKMFREHAMKRHEEMCFRNPENKRPCFTCQHFEMKEVDVNWQDPVYYADHTEKKTLMFCNKFNHCLISPQTSIKGNAISSDDLYDYDNEDMPLNCGEWVVNLPF